jgi:ribosomal protein S18 acetylase RimI-like enzyme
MIKLFQDKFDTEILGCNVFKLFVDEEIKQKQQLEDQLREHKMDLLCGFTKFSADNISFFECNKFNLISLRTTYGYTGMSKQKIVTIPEGFTLRTGQQKQSDINPSDIIEIANVLGNTSRYFKDKKIDTEKSLQLYITWIENSIFRGYANECLLLMEGNRLAGIHTLKIKNNTGYVDLIGVCNNYQGMGLGKILLYKGIEWLQKQNVEKIDVVTEAENIPATAFYQKNGFIVNNIELIYHKHF